MSATSRAPAPPTVETRVRVSRDKRGSLDVSLCRTARGTLFVELHHFDGAGLPGSRLSLRLSELSEVRNALLQLAMRARLLQEPAEQKILPMIEPGPTEQTVAEMAEF